LGWIEKEEIKFLFESNSKTQIVKRKR